MRRTGIRILLGAVLVAGMVGGGAAAANEACVSYRVTTGQSGTSQDAQCVWQPDQFDMLISIQNCRGVPPVGLTVCVGASVNVPAP